MAARASTEPRTSKRPGFLSFTSGMASTPSRKATPTMGTFTRNAECQLKCSSRKPPMSGPAAMPMALMADHAATAIARSFESVKMLRIMDMVIGMIIAPPMPRKARMVMSWLASLMNTTSTEPMPKIRKPARSIFFLPNLSDSELVATRKPAKTSEYTSTIQRSWSDEVLRSRVSSGSAMLRTVRSMATTNCPNNIATIAVHKRPFESVCGLTTIESSIMGVPSYRCFLRYVALLLGAYSSMLSTTPLMSALSPTTAIS